MSAAGAAETAIVIVEDSAAIRSVLHRMLACHGFAPYSAADAAGARLLARTHVVQAFLVDLGLAGAESGLDFLTWLRLQPNYAVTPVTILTGLPCLSDEQEAVIRGSGAEVFYKPGRFQVLIDHLSQVVTPAAPPG